jgi:predicted transposase YbfD/YdcC
MLADRLGAQVVIGRVGHGRRDVLPKKHNRKDRRARWRLRLSGQRQPEKPSRRYPNRVRNAGFPPSRAGRTMNKRPTAASSNARSRCCLPKRSAPTPSGRVQIAKVESRREVKRKGQWVSENETAWLITSLTATEASPKALLTYNRDHWRIENNLHRNKDVTLDEDAYTNRKDQAPRNIFTLNAIVLELAASFGLSPKIAIERCQDDKSLAVAWLGA